MGFFIVNQNNKNFKEEFHGKFIWARAYDNIFHHESLKEVNKNDIIFSKVSGKLKSVNIALNSYYISKNPFLNHKYPDVDGYRVELNYYLVNENINFKELFDEIKEMLPEKYSPINKLGNGHQGYLFKIGDKFGNYLLKKAKMEEIENL
uniref:Uncharacterized protein n=1 Tax=Methanococcus maripaludis (strain C6 / ATCC BAA-1332) TaxID=444158 RepID=A9AA05_METM6